MVSLDRQAPLAVVGLVVFISIFSGTFGGKDLVLSVVSPGEYEYNSEAIESLPKLLVSDVDDDQSESEDTLKKDAKRTIRLVRRNDEDIPSSGIAISGRRSKYAEVAKLRRLLGDYHAEKYHLTPEEKRTIRVIDDKRTIRLVD